ncbi:hypothetical protein CTEN210_01144 [Chaetoceros tenuissimus]|uniref:Leucine-rich repeat domain-containing protein n=1 Tax=Chaetoceros tenuissimus TaxID=426638 RepID=A0AAD3CHF2_9STRA|nr:hypothetical protein CTEN210_01144 [Chaetoceros tenuissimus]
MRFARVDGLMTLFYDGSADQVYNQLLASQLDHAFMYYQDYENDEAFLEECVFKYPIERMTEAVLKYWRNLFKIEQLIILEGVTEIPENTFFGCVNLKRVIFANTVRRIEKCAFMYCYRLACIKLSTALEYIGVCAFDSCDIYSVYIPPSCREICDHSFAWNFDLEIFHVPQQTLLGECIMIGSSLLSHSSFEEYEIEYESEETINPWIKNINDEEEYALHRACLSYHPLKEIIFAIVNEKGLGCFTEKNDVGISPSEYLKENPYTELTEKEIIHDYIMSKMCPV